MFKVPERFRESDGIMGSDSSIGNAGVFNFPSVIKGRMLHAIASDGSGYDHVSVYASKHNERYIPRWGDMCLVKDLFWGEDDTVIQFHPKHSEYVNINEFVLHLWRKQGVEYELPPRTLI
ncbi:MAG: hypothetical protein DRQ48_00985 [Gammaproteobacteria bacterium]|nr:MAG: hypothetical protein DRQ44_00385 [Gammaproteobacteria bacterium]RKZ72254.1 MAG: hypothetical protein DRQ48_00985 [Gammaproteobacteria bacterium]